MTKKQKKSLYIITAAVIPFVLGFVLPENPAYLRQAVQITAYIIAGFGVLKKAAVNLVHGRLFDENFLMAFATVGALGIGEFSEAAAVMIFYRVGELFESVAVGKSRKSIASLMDMRPDFANVIRGGEVISVDPEEVSVGETIIVKPGERIPLDGIVEEGESCFDTSALTGEALPVAVIPGQSAPSGCVNLTGTIKIKVTSRYEQSTVAKILELVEGAAANKARPENFVTRFARIYTPVVVALAACIAVIPPLILGGFSVWFRRALVFLVVSCPCALVISVPLTFFGAVGGASRRGILVKGSMYFERLAKLKTLFFDKTGTLTEGKFSVCEILPAGVSEQYLVEAALLAEHYSGHPLAVSVKSTFKDVKVDASSISGYEELAGLGVKCLVNGELLLAGNVALMESGGVKALITPKQVTAIHFSLGGRYIGCITLADNLKATSPTAVKRLKTLGVDSMIMLTGDRESTASSVAERLGLNGFRAGLLPQDKADIVAECVNSGESVVGFVGDGINDAPVLALADVGIAMGGLGSDAAIEAADVVIMDDDPLKIAEAVKISRKAMRIAGENIVFSILVKLIVLAFGAFGLAGMWIAVFADVGVSVIAILNAVRMLIGNNI